MCIPFREQLEAKDQHITTLKAQLAAMTTRAKKAEEILQSSAVRCENCLHSGENNPEIFLECDVRGTYHQFTCDWWTPKDDKPLPKAELVTATSIESYCRDSGCIPYQEGACMACEACDLCDIPRYYDYLRDNNHIREAE